MTEIDAYIVFVDIAVYRMLFLLQSRLDDKNAENASLQRQLESAISDLKRQKEQEREHISTAVSSLPSVCCDEYYVYLLQSSLGLLCETRVRLVNRTKITWSDTDLVD